MSASSTAPPASERDRPLSSMQQAILDIRALRARLQAAEGRNAMPIAITGMACRFPGGADTPAGFWRLLADGVDAVGDLPGDRWDVAQWYDPDPDAPAKMSTRYGGFLKDVDQFDAEFFGISDREAVSVDPQHRLLLEVAWSALEDAGLPAETVFGSKTGVFIGISSFDYASLRGQTGDIAQVDAYHATGIAHSAGAGRLSYYFGLQGPAIAIDTACSSSLVAIHLACQSLRSGECGAALAGGINLILSPEIHVTLSKARMLAPDGRCKAFDASANGFVRSEGCGMLVLKRLDDAIRDGDRIHAVIRGSACNQDGRSSGLSAPNGPSQTAVVKAAWAAAGVKPDEIDYVEAHGTGTALGDPIEAGALSAALKDASPDHVLAIGSVKTNLGHMEAAAGVGGVIKTILALRHEEIPASLHFKEGSANIDWAGSRLKVVSEATAWPRGEKPRLAGISSFGFSGTNVHIVLEEQPVAPAPAPAPATRVLAVSAINEPALAEVAGQLARTLRETASRPDAWAEFTRGVNARRSHFPVRAAWVASSPEEALADLEALASGQPTPAVLRGRAEAMRPPMIAFVAGDVSGPQSDPRADDLYATSPDFRQALDACSPPDTVDGRAHADGRAFAIQFALARTLRAWVGAPVSVRGEGVGAFVAACVAGALSPEDAVALVALRGAYLDAGDAGAGDALAAYRGALAEVTFAAPSLGGAAIGLDFWLAEAAAVKAGSEHPLELGGVSEAIALDLRPSPTEPASPFACARGPSLRTSMLHAVAALYVRGTAVDWRSVEEPTPGRAADLPGYPWSRRAYWFPKASPPAQPVEAWSAMVAATAKQADQIPVDMHLHSYAAKYRALARLASAYIIRTLDELGSLDEPDTILSAERLVDHFGVQQLYRQLMDIWLDSLAEEGLIERAGADFVTIGRLSAKPVEPHVAEAEAVFVEEPILLDYINGCGAVLTAVIKGELSPLETLFPNGSIELAERIYHRAALSRYFNAIAAAAARSFAAGQPGLLRVLEIGGGTGGVTGSILAALPAERTRYTFSDISAFFFEPAAKRFAEFGFVDFAVLDIEQDAEAQGFQPGGYDLIVAANVLHATADLGRTMDAVRGLLAPGGALLLYEVTHPPAYFNISIALIEGWQKSSDSIRTIGPLIDTDAWKALLPEHGFDLIEAWPRETSPAEVLGSHLFMARATGAGATPATIAALPARSTAFAVAPAEAEQEDDVRGRLVDAPDSEHRSILVDFVRRRVGVVLKRPEGSDIAADRRLMDLGLDSLMALELRNSLAKGLHLEQSLPSTLMFDHPSIAAIADFLLARVRGEDHGAASPAVAPPPVTAAPTPEPSTRLAAETIDELSDEDVERLLNERLGSLLDDKT